jgi:hypothetical protein
MDQLSNTTCHSQKLITAQLFKSDEARDMTFMISMLANVVQLVELSLYQHSHPGYPDKCAMADDISYQQGFHKEKPQKPAQSISPAPDREGQARISFYLNKGSGGWLPLIGPRLQFPA